MSKYRKAIGALVLSLIGGLGAWAPIALSDNHVSLGEWYGLGGVILTCVATTFGVYQLPNAQ